MLDALPIVLLVLPKTNVSTARMVLSFKVVLATKHVPQELSPIYKLSSASLVTPHAKLASTIQVHVPVVSQAKDTFNSLETRQVVSRNALKELSLEMVFVKYVTSGVQNVWDQLQIVSHAQSTHSCTTALAGTTAQESCQTEFA